MTSSVIGGSARSASSSDLEMNTRLPKSLVIQLLLTFLLGSATWTTQAQMTDTIVGRLDRMMATAAQPHRPSSSSTVAKLEVIHVRTAFRR